MQLTSWWRYVRLSRSELRVSQLEWATSQSFEFLFVGGIAEYHLRGSFKEDGHFLVDYPDSVPVWSPIVAKFLGQYLGKDFATK